MNANKKSENFSRVRVNSDKQQKCVKKRERKYNNISTKNNLINKNSSTSPSNEQKEKLTLTICFNSKESNERENCFVKKNVKCSKNLRHNQINNSPSLSNISDSDLLVISEDGSKSASDCSEINLDTVGNKDFIYHDTENSNKLPTFCFNNSDTATIKPKDYTELDIEPLIIPSDFTFNKCDEFNIAIDVFTLKAASDYIKGSISQFDPGTIDVIQSFGIENIVFQNSTSKSSGISGKFLEFSNNPDSNDSTLPSNSEDAESSISLVSCNTNDIQLDIFDMPYEETIEEPNYFYSNTNLKNIETPLQELIFDSDINVASNVMCPNEIENIEPLNTLAFDYCGESSKGKRKSFRYTEKCKFNKKSSNINNCVDTVSNNEEGCDEKHFRNESDKDSNLGNSETAETFIETCNENGKKPINPITLLIETNASNDNKQNTKKRRRRSIWDSKKRKCNKKNIYVNAKNSQYNELKFKMEEIHCDTCEEDEPDELNLGNEPETIRLLESEEINIFKENNCYDKLLSNCKTVKRFLNCESNSDQESIAVQQSNNSNNVESLKKYSSTYNTRSCRQSNFSAVKDNCNTGKIFKKQCKGKNKSVKVKSMQFKDFELENKEVFFYACDQDEHYQSIVNNENRKELSKLEEKEILKSNAEHCILFNTKQTSLKCQNSNDDDNVISNQESCSDQEQKRTDSEETIMNIENSKCIQSNTSFLNAVNNTNILLPVDQELSCYNSDENILNISNAKSNEKSKIQQSNSNNSTECIKNVSSEKCNKKDNSSSINENVYQMESPFLNTVSGHSTSEEKKCLELSLKAVNKEQNASKNFSLNDVDRKNLCNQEYCILSEEKSNENENTFIQLNRKMSIPLKKLKLTNCDIYGTFKIKDIVENMSDENGLKKNFNIVANETNINKDLFDSINHSFHSHSKEHDTKEVQPDYLKNNSCVPVECCSISNCHDNIDNDKKKSEIEKENFSQPFQTDNTIPTPEKSHDSTKNSKDLENESFNINCSLLEFPTKKTSITPISKSLKSKKCGNLASSLPNKQSHNKCHKVANKIHDKVQPIVESNLNIKNSPAINSSNSSDNLLNNILQSDNSDSVKPTNERIFDELLNFEFENSNTIDSCKLSHKVVSPYNKTDSKALRTSKNKKINTSKRNLNTCQSKNVSKFILGKKKKVKILKSKQPNDKNRKKTNIEEKSVISENKLSYLMEDVDYTISDSSKNKDSIINNLKSPNNNNKYDFPKKELENNTNFPVLVIPPNINDDLNNEANFTAKMKNMKRIPKLSSKKKCHTSVYFDEKFIASKENYCSISSNTSEKSNVENEETNIKVPVNYTSPETGSLQEDLDFEPDIVDYTCIEDLPSSSLIEKSSNSSTPFSFEKKLTSQECIVEVSTKNSTSKNIAIDLYSDSNVQTLNHDLCNTPESIPCLNYPDNFQIISQRKEFLSEDDSDSDHDHSFKRLYHRGKNGCEQPAEIYISNKNVENTLQINETAIPENEMINNEVPKQDISYKKDKSFSPKPPEKLNNQDFTSPVKDRKTNKTVASCLITKTENPLGHSYRLEDVVIKIKCFCNAKSVDEAVKIAQTHISISSDVINTLLINELFHGLLKLIDINHLNIDISIINAFDQILKFVNDYSICNKHFLSNFIIKCCSYQGLQMFSIKMFYICQNKKISISNKAIKDFGSFLQNEVVSVPVLLNFLDYVKTECNRNRPKELVHLALEKCKRFKFSYSHSMCLCLHNISFKEVDPTNLEEFLKLCLKKNMWANIADLFIAWDTHYELLELMYSALVSDYKNTSYYFKKFTDYLCAEDLTFSQKNFIGQIGTAVMLCAFSVCELQCALEVLYILHALNINYFELQLRAYNSYIAECNKDFYNFEIKAFPYFVIFIAVDLCLNFKRYKDAFTVFQGFSWLVPDQSYDAELKSLIINQRFQRLLKLVPHLNSDTSLNEGVEALKVLLMTIEQDLSQEDLEENAKGLQIIFNQYLISLLNNEKISSVKDLCQYIVGPCKDILSLNSNVLRGLIVAFLENSMIEEASTLFMMGLVKKTYSIEKPQHNSFPWHMTIMTNWTVHEIKLAVEWFLEVLFPLLTDKPSNTDFEKWFSVEIVFKIGNQNNSNIHCLKNVSSTVENSMKKTCEALEQMRPSLKVIHEVAEKSLRITSDSLYNFWKGQFPNAAKLTSFMSCLETKEKKISFGKSPVSVAATEQNSILKPKECPILVEHSPSTTKNLMSQKDTELSENVISEINREVKLINLLKSPQTSMPYKLSNANGNISNSLLLTNSPKKHCISSNQPNKISLNMDSDEFQKSVNKTLERISICGTSNSLISNNNYSSTMLDESNLTTVKVPNKNSVDDECIISKNKEQKHLRLNTLLPGLKLMPKSKNFLKMKGKDRKNKNIVQKFKKNKNFKNFTISITPNTCIRTISNCNTQPLDSNIVSSLNLVENEELGHTNNLLLNKINSVQSITNRNKSKNNIQIDKTIGPMLNVTLDNNSPQSHVENIMQGDELGSNLHTDNTEFNPSFQVALDNCRSECLSKKSPKCAIQIHEKNIINLSQQSVPIDKSTFSKTMNTLSCSTNSSISVTNTRLNVTQRNSVNVQSKSSKPMINRNFSFSVNNDLPSKKVSNSVNIHKDKSTLCSNISNRPVAAKKVSSIDSQLKISKPSSGSISCDEEFNKIIQFLKIKILQKHKNLTSTEQHDKAVVLAQTFVQNNVVTKLEKKTMKVLAEFAVSNI